MKNTSKRLGSAILACTLALTQLSATALATDTLTTSAKSTLSDVSSSWAASSIERWLDVGLVQGDEQGKFNPSNNLTRGELATIFTNMFGLTERATNNYADLNGNEWYADAILKCTAAGIMNGDGKNCNATAAITRQEAMTMFARALGIEAGNVATLSKFTDGSSTASWAASALAAMVDMNIISGVGNGLLAPTANIDRASTMKLLDNAIANYVTGTQTIEANNGNKFIIVDSSSGTVQVSGYTAGVIVTSGSRSDITIKGLIADVIKVDSGVNVTISGDSSIKQLDINGGSSVSISQNSIVTTVNLNSAAKVENSGKIENLIVNEKSTINNNGTISYAKINVSNVIIDGKAPIKMGLETNVTAPTTSKGQTVTETGSTSSGGSGSSGGGSSSSSVTTVTVYNINSDIDVVKTKYEYGDELDLTNVKLKVNYSDGTDNIINVDNNSSVTVTVAKKDATSTASQDIVLDDGVGEYTVTLTYMGKSVTYDITVTEKSITSASITGLSEIAPVVGGEAYTIAKDVDVTPVCCEVDSIAWSDGSESAVKTFEAGKTYTATISLTANENYKFDTVFVPSVDVDGTVNKGEVAESGKNMTFTITFPETVVDDSAITSDNVYRLITALKSEYTEGMSWTNDNYYKSDSLDSAGYGCEAFALICSDAAFGSLPVSKTHSNFDDILVGDMIRMNNDTHTVIVLEKKADSVIVAEGNYNSSIHWGREISRQSLEDGNFTVRTRYPEV